MNCTTQPMNCATQPMNSATQHAAQVEKQMADEKTGRSKKKIYKIWVENLLTRQKLAFLGDRSSVAFTEKTVSDYAETLVRQYFNENKPVTIYVVTQHEEGSLVVRLVYVNHQHAYKEMHAIYTKMFARLEQMKKRSNPTIPPPPKKVRVISPPGLSGRGSPEFYQPRALLQKLWQVSSVGIGTEISSSIPPKKRIGKKS